MEQLFYLYSSDIYYMYHNELQLNVYLLELLKVLLCILLVILRNLKMN